MCSCFNTLSIARIRKFNVLFEHVKRPLSKRPKKVFKTNYCLMQVKIIQREHSAILSTFIKLPIVIKIFVLSIFEWPFYTDFTVCFNLKIFKMSPPSYLYDVIYGQHCGPNWSFCLCFCSRKRCVQLWRCDNFMMFESLQRTYSFLSLQCFEIFIV